MSTLRFDGTNVEFEDRLLTHLHIVIGNKLRRGELFMMSWVDAGAIGDGRSSSWVHMDGDLFFKFAGSRVPGSDAEWLTLLAESANGSRGLIVMAQDGSLASAGHTGHP